MNVIRNLTQAVISRLEKPHFTVTNKTDFYEERDYTATVWVSTKYKSITQREADSAGFRRLFNYIQGENESKTKIPMTAPVLTRIDPGLGPNCESTFTVSFYVGESYAANPPKPTNPHVFIQRWPECSMYVRQFGGFADDTLWLKEARDLANAIQSKPDVQQDYHFTAGYDAPFKMFNRTNEVWFEKRKTATEVNQ